MRSNSHPLLTICPFFSIDESSYCTAVYLFNCKSISAWSFYCLSLVYLCLFVCLSVSPLPLSPLSFYPKFTHIIFLSPFNPLSPPLSFILIFVPTIYEIPCIKRYGVTRIINQSNLFLFFLHTIIDQAISSRIMSLTP